MFRAVTWLLAGGPLQPGLGWRRHGRPGAPGRLHFLMAIATLAVCLLPASVAHAQSTTPTFASSNYDREVAENTAAGENIGNPVTATGGTGALTYTLDATGAASFDIVAASGQLRTKTGVTYDHEATGSYSVTVTATDTASMTATATVAITVTDVDEPPLAPPLADSIGNPGVYDQIIVRWEAPDDTGRPPVTGYDVRYDDGGNDWLDGPQDVIGTEAIINDLRVLTPHIIQLRAENDEGNSPWVYAGGDHGEVEQSQAGFYFLVSGILPVEVERASGSTDDFPRVSYIPSGLNAGDEFRLLLVRAPSQEYGFIAATYRFVNQYQYIAGEVVKDSPLRRLSKLASPILSTRLFDAREVSNTTYTNDNKGVPIYWFRGSRVVDNYEDFYDGDWDDESNFRDELGNLIPVPQRVWTGSASDGTRLVEGGVSKVMGEPQVGYGTPGSTAAGVGPLYSGSTADATEELPFYTLSPVFRVRSPSSVSNWEQHKDVLDALLDEIDENLPFHEYDEMFEAITEQYLVDSTDVRAERRSQRFTTGPHPNGYEEIGIQVRTFRGPESTYNIIPETSLHTVDEGGRPDALVAEMETPDSWVSHGFTFQSPEGTVLSPNTTYAVVVVAGNVGEALSLVVNTSNDEDADETEEGWSLADAFDIEGTGGWSAHPEGKSLLLRVRATPTDGPPGKPADLTATALGRHQIDLAWTAPLDGGSAITGYKIESSTDSETTWSDLVADTQSDVASYSHTGLSPNTTVHYRVSAISALGTSSASDPANDTTDDFPAVTVQFGQGSYTLAEDETVNVTISLSEAPLQETVVPITATGQGGAGPSDYSVPASVTFNAGDTEQTIAFEALEDTDDDDDESVKLGFGTPLPSRVSLGTRTETTLSIRDNDNPVVTVMFTTGAHTLAEGGMQQITVTVSEDPERTMIIPITATPQTPATTDDYSVPASITFNAAETSRTIIFSAAQDQVDENSESVKLGFGTMPDPQVSAGSPDEVTLTITDDDMADIVISPASLTVGENAAASYTVKLATEPTVNVSVTITGHSGTDLALNKTTLTFTDTSWDAAQTVTVTAGDDDGAGNDAAP